MAAEVPTVEPSEIIAGDTISWEKTLTDYLPSDGWGLTYTLKGPTDQSSTVTLITGVATTDDDVYTVTFQSADTASLVAGDYWLRGYVELDSDRYTIFTAIIPVKPDSSSITTSDDRTDNEIMLDLVDAVLRARIPKDINSYQWEQYQTMKMKPVDELLKLKKYYQQQIQNERGQTFGSVQVIMK